MNKFLTCFLIVFVFAISCKKDTVIGDDQANYFLKVFGGSSTDICNSLISKDNYLYFTGSIKYQGVPNMYLIKTDGFGNQLSDFPKYLGPVGVESAGYDIGTDRDNNLIMAGTMYSSQNDTTHIFVVKTNSNGDILWSKRFGGGKSNNAYSLYSSSDLIYVAGYTDNYLNKGRQGWLLALSQNGDSIWSNDYGINNINVNDELHDIIDLSDSLLIIGTTQNILDYARTDVFAFILKKTTHGIENSRTFYKVGNEQSVSAVKGEPNVIYVLGYTIDSDKKCQIYIWKLDFDLNILIEGPVGSTVSETPSSIFFENGNIVIVGTAVGNNKEDFFVYKLDSDLKVLSRVTYGSVGDQKGKTAVINDKSIIIGGGVSTSNSSMKACIFKTPW